MRELSVSRDIVVPELLLHVEQAVFRFETEQKHFLGSGSGLQRSLIGVSKLKPIARENRVGKA